MAVLLLDLCLALTGLSVTMIDGLVDITPWYFFVNRSFRHSKRLMMEIAKVAMKIP